jgi:hypothetical protein
MSALPDAGYKATRFLHMLHDRGGLPTAQLLLHSTTVSEVIRRYGSVAALI